MVKAAILTAVSASISTPVFPVSDVSASISMAWFSLSKEKSILAWVIFKGWLQEISGRMSLKA